MRRYAIIGPNDEEVENFISLIEEHTQEKQLGLDIHLGTVEGKAVLCVVSGICKVNPAIVTQMLIERYALKAVIVCGVAGAIADLEIGDTVIATEVAHHDVKPSFLQEYYPFLRHDTACFTADASLVEVMKRALQDYPKPVYYGRVVSGEYFVDQKGRQEIIANFDPLAVDMETAGVAHACHVNAMPFIAIRSITDNEKQSGLENFRLNFELARNNAQEILVRFLKELS